MAIQAWLDKKKKAEEIARIKREAQESHLSRIHSLDDTTDIERRIESSKKGHNEAVEAVKALISGSRESGG